LAKISNVFYPTLEKTLVPLPLCELDKKQGCVPKGRCREMTKGARIDLGTMKGVQVC